MIVYRVEVNVTGKWVGPFTSGLLESCSRGLHEKLHVFMGINSLHKYNTGKDLYYAYKNRCLATDLYNVLIEEEGLPCRVIELDVDPVSQDECQITFKEVDYHGKTR